MLYNVSKIHCDEKIIIGRRDRGCAEPQIGPNTGQIMEKSSIKHCKKVSFIFLIFKGGEGSRGIYLIAPESG